MDRSKSFKLFSYKILQFLQLILAKNKMEFNSNFFNPNRTDSPRHHCSAPNFRHWLFSLPDFGGFVGSVLYLQPVRESVLNSFASFHGGGCSWFMIGYPQIFLF